MTAFAGASVKKAEQQANPTLRVTFRNDDLLVVNYGESCVAVWSRTPTLSTFEIQRAQLRSMVSRAPGRAHFMCVVGVDANPPEPEIRRASSRMITEHGDRLASCACVIEGTGFRAALTRTALSGIVLLIQSKAPIEFFSGISAAALWQRERGAVGSVAPLVEGLRALRAEPRGK